jgi:hypothetical protein
MARTRMIPIPLRYDDKIRIPSTENIPTTYSISYLHNTRLNTMLKKALQEDKSDCDTTCNYASIGLWLHGVNSKVQDFLHVVQRPLQ